jgi:hypothetical protein
MPRRTKTTDDFPTRIVTLWQVCLDNRLDLTCDSPGQAVHLRQQMYAYRLKARQEKLPQAVFMDDYTLEVNGNKLTGAISGIGAKINELLASSLENSHNTSPLPSPSSEAFSSAQQIPMTDDAIKRAQSIAEAKAKEDLYARLGFGVTIPKDATPNT